MNTPREPLSQEERALAERLARASGPREPGPALDARILAAAQAAVDDLAPASPPVAAAPTRAAPDESRNSPAIGTPGRSRRRWPLGLGIAASLLLAVTIAWQLRPQHSLQLVYETAEAPTAPPPATAQATPASTTDSSAASSSASAPPPATLDPSTKKTGSTPPSPSTVPRPRRLSPLVPAMAPAPPELPEIERREAAPVPNAAPAPAPVFKAQELRRVETYTPPAPPSPPAPMPDIAVDAAAAHQPLAGRAAAAATDTQQHPENLSRISAAPPPATALAAAPADQAAPGVQDAVAQDSRLPADAWLQRVRRHRFDGNGALARASLRAFRQAHPDQAIPEDLRALLP